MKSEKTYGLGIAMALLLAACSSATGTGTTSTTSSTEESVGAAVGSLFSDMGGSASQSALALEGEQGEQGDRPGVCETTSGPEDVEISTAVSAGHYGMQSDGLDVASATTCSEANPVMAWTIAASGVEMDCTGGNVTFQGGQGVFIDDRDANETRIYGSFIIGGATYFCDVTVTSDGGSSETFAANCEDASANPVEQSTETNTCTSPSH